MNREGSAMPPSHFPKNPFAWLSSGIKQSYDLCTNRYQFGLICFVVFRKVYAILMVQLSVTVGFIALFVYEPNVKMYSRQHPEMWWIAFAMTFILLIVLACCNDFRRRWPLNIILLSLFTLCEGFMLGAVSSLYQVRNFNIFFFQ